MFWADTILLFSGLCVIALGLMLSQRLGNSPVQLGFEKLGLDLKADRLTFVLIIGVTLIAVGVYFRYRDYEKELAKLNDQVSGFALVQKQHNENFDMLKRELQSFKVYDLSLRIDFPEGMSGDNFELGVWTKKPGSPTFELSSFKPVFDFENTYGVRLTNLDQGERIKISGRSKLDGSEWDSVSDIEIPETQVQMKRRSNGEMR